MLLPIVFSRQWTSVMRPFRTGFPEGAYFSIQIKPCTTLYSRQAYRPLTGMKSDPLFPVERLSESLRAFEL